jgi:hypothetical protein
MKVTSSKKVTNSEPLTIKSNLQKLQAIKKVRKSNKKMKKVNKKSLPLRVYSLPLQALFCGQIASSLRPYGRSGQIICIGYKYLMLCKEAFRLMIVIICIIF